MEFWNYAILFGAFVLLLAVVASDISSRLGAPLLLAFLGLGMLAGEDGPGGIRFDDFQAAYAIGTLALAVIIFDGGLRTRQETFRVALGPAVALATVGVVLTAGLLAIVAVNVLPLTPLEGLLVGSIIGSTDAAAVFALLRTRGANLQQRVGTTLEVESASNDPMAIFMTVAVLEIILAGQTRVDAAILLAFVKQFGIGAILGALGGKLLQLLINRLTLETALYPLLAVAGALLVFAVTAQVGGSGFLAIYVAGVILGNSKLRGGLNILRVHEGLAWLSQIVMFVILGLLLTPSQLLGVIGPGLAIALGLVFFARPIAVFACLAPFRLPWREQVYIAWVGLRGAVPVVLALFPLMYNVEGARLFFNITFFAVLVSLVLQGWTIAPAARWLKLEVPPQVEPVARVSLDETGDLEHQVIGFRAQRGSLAVGRPLSAMELPPNVQVSALMRGGEPVALGPEVIVAEGDLVYFMARARDIEALGRFFDPHRVPERLEEHQFFGDFRLNGEARLADVAMAYGLPAPADHNDRTIAQYLDDHVHGRVVVGDRVRVGGAELVAREVRDGRILVVGLRLPGGRRIGLRPPGKTRDPAQEP